MTDTVVTDSSRTPVHLWAVGALALLWNGFGCIDYFMTRTRGAEWINSMMSGVDGEKYMAYIDAFPIWAAAGWGLGVWMGLAGAILLLMRKRLPVSAFGLSLLGAVVGVGYQIMNPVDIAEMSEGAAGMMNYVVILIALGLFLYARAQAARGRLA